jgi:hypothetical protein
MVVETDKHLKDAQKLLITLNLEIEERRALLKVRTKAARTLRREIALYNTRKVIDRKS